MRVGITATARRTIPDRTRAIAQHLMMAAVVWMLFAAQAHAQVCQDDDAEENSSANSSSSSTSSSSSNAQYFLNCDMKYKNTELMCDTYTVRGSCPSEPMEMKTTPNLSLIKGFSPYLYAYARDPDDRNKPYSGTYYRGTPGDASQTFGLICPPGRRCPASCTAQLKFPVEKGPADALAKISVEEQAKMVRLQLDNCANQYILNSAMYPAQKENTFLQSGENRDDGSARISLATSCQPLETVLDTKNEYFPTVYLRAAWIKLMQNPAYRMNPRAPAEPHLPTGVTIDNPIAPPTPFPDVRLSQIGAIKYEEINDPTHPYSPRWDYRYNERDHYSPLTTIYQDPTENAVFCAGEREADSNNSETSEEDQIVKVDVLEFRHAKFDKWTTKRIGFNTACFLDDKIPNSEIEVPIMIKPVVGIPDPRFIAMKAASYCYRIIAPPIPAVLPYYQGYEGKAKRVKCWEGCYNLDGKTDDKDDHPPCTTFYEGSDRRIGGGLLPGALNGGTRKASCEVNKRRSGDNNMEKLCRDLRAPYTSLNKLKMRYHNPDEEENIVLKEGVPEGYTFKEYFGNRMPYPRLWDTGRSIQESTSDGQAPRDTAGQYTAIVGVGHEGTPGDDEESSDNQQSGDGEGSSDESREDQAKTQRKKDQRCLYGGWGGNVSMGGARINLPDPIASWTELKLYQTRTLRDLGLSCLGRYEKTYKLGSTEEKALSGYGADVTQGIITETDSNKKTTYTSVAKWLKDNPKRDKPLPGTTQLRQETYPLGWRGYLSAKDDDQKFPNFPGDSATTETGLDNAKPGDIIIMENGASGENANGKRGLPRLALVTREMQKGTWIKVMEADNGKWPDACGTTDGWGELKTRYLYKSSVPKEAQNEYKRINSTDDCADTHLSQCVAKNWDKLKLYRPRANIREGNDGSELQDPPAAGGT